MLHIITPSPYHSTALDDCLRVCRSGDVLLLLGDATYATTQPGDKFDGLNVQVLQEHVTERGLPDVTWASYIDYLRMVELTEKQHPVQTWF